MTELDVEIIRKKLNELDESFKKSTLTLFTYLNSIVQILIEAGITDQKKFKKILDGYKKQYGAAAQHAEFLKLIRQFKPKDKK